jgi:hypothetical protein
MASGGTYRTYRAKNMRNKGWKGEKGAEKKTPGNVKTEKEQLVTIILRFRRKGTQNSGGGGGDAYRVIWNPECGPGLALFQSLPAHFTRRGLHTRPAQQ